MIRTFKELKATDVQLAAFMTQLMFFLLFCYKQGILIPSQGLCLVLEVVFLADFVKRWQTQLYGKGKEVVSKNPSHTFTDEDKERQKAANSDIESSARGWVYLRQKRFFTDEG